MVLPCLVQYTAWQCLTSHTFNKSKILLSFDSFSVSHDANTILKYPQRVGFKYYGAGLHNK